jgi:alpha-L-fucosidase
MKFYLKHFLLAIALLWVTNTSAQLKSRDPKMDWFENARLGIFIHWGIYSVNGIPESWSFFNNYISYEDYMKQLNGFNASNYDPELWVRLIKESGAGYAVITSKHHDGVALWDSKMGGINTVKDSKARKDLLTPFVKALKKSGLKTGIYYSLPDWSYPDYDVMTREVKRYALKSEPERWLKFQNYFTGQLKELSEQYNPDLYWFDGDWEHNAQEWRSAEVQMMLQKRNPGVIINSRLNGYGDYATPEQGVPVVRPSAPYWELCLTTNDSWGYVFHDKNYKTSNQVIRTFIDCVANGGNLLLDIGPKPDGTIPAEQIKILQDLGAWNKKHAEAIFGTRAGICGSNFQGKTTISVDGKTIYVFVENVPTEDVEIRNLAQQPKMVRVIGTDLALKYKLDSSSGVTYISIDENQLDPMVTVIALEFEKPAEFLKELPKMNYENLLKLSAKNENASPVDFIHALANDSWKGDFSFKTQLAQIKPSSPIESQLYLDANSWLNKHAEALIGSAGLPQGYYDGFSTLSPDKQTLYLFVDGKPNGPLQIKGIKNKINRIRIVGNGTLLSHQILNKQYWSEVPGMLYIPVPEDQLDSRMTVIAVLLDKPLNLHQEEIKPIESN